MDMKRKIFAGVAIAGLVVLLIGCMAFVPPDRNQEVEDLIQRRDQMSEAEYQAELESIKRKSSTQRFEEWSWGRRD